ncbi:NO-inducible flavohemoprotein [Chitinophaga sp. Cy-1792]|uniref:NO-inducible flavohemoprotein n=1 Tax=Chitinophaga sp. Cy-1792 TaxID=2608339 RepID=UPI0014208005|nr:NO-inducible flavohemoprotein [Chitinophaga sp. Cy-1792]NIG53407.1 NO-inducible flavohemoprotein [Chitinophaga sp. Cy-1792]
MKPVQIELVKATVPVLKEHGRTLTTHFYQRMFTHNPELKNIFNMGNQQNGKQQAALAMAVLAYAEHIENPAVLLPVVDSIGHKHASLDIRPEHYQIVGKHLIASIAEVLGAAATAEILDAWTAAYQQLASIMMGHEAGIYEQKTASHGGWTGWRPFIVKQKIKESEEITSFLLYPADNGPVADFQPGQYLSVRLFLPEINLLQPRQYSISCAPNGEYYRISVKQEAGSTHPDGMISNALHHTVKEGDMIEVSAPAGIFVLQENENPVVFISGGVGQTPLLSMLEHLLNNDHKQTKYWIHGCRGEEVHAFKNTISNWTATENNLVSHIFYDKVSQETAQLKQGWVDLAALPEMPEDATYYICGPAGFIKKHFEYLTAKGISPGAIRFEEFGPASLQLN